MGDYTKIQFDVELKKDSSIVKFYTEFLGNYNLTCTTPGDEFFDLPRWRQLHLGSSAYHCTGRSFAVGAQAYTDYYENAELHISSSFKNNDEELFHFLKFISPHVHCIPGEIVGYVEMIDHKRPNFLYYHPEAKTIRLEFSTGKY